MLVYGELYSLFSTLFGHLSHIHDVTNTTSRLTPVTIPPSPLCLLRVPFRRTLFGQMLHFSSWRLGSRVSKSLCLCLEAQQFKSHCLWGRWSAWVSLISLKWLLDTYNSYGSLDAATALSQIFCFSSGKAEPYQLSQRYCSHDSEESSILALRVWVIWNVNSSLCFLFLGSDLDNLHEMMRQFSPTYKEDIIRFLSKLLSSFSRSANFVNTFFCMF